MSIFGQCPKCNYKNQNASKVCPQCGQTLELEVFFRQSLEAKVLLKIRDLANDKTTSSSYIKKMAVDTLLYVKKGSSLNDMVRSGGILENNYPELKGFTETTLTEALSFPRFSRHKKFPNEVD